MNKTIAVFGAGSGLGTSVARRFGHEGYRVALVARRQAPLEALVSSLQHDGIDAQAFSADLTRTEMMPGLVTAIEDRFGSIDVLEYAPITPMPFIPAAQLDAETLSGFINLYLLTPITLVQAVLPAMIARGNGAILIGYGSSALRGMPYMSGVGPVMAAARNYAYSLHGELAEKGIYVGTLAITAMIVGSAWHQNVTSGELASTIPVSAIPVVEPDALAAQYWDMLHKRDQIEVVYPATH